MRALHLRWRSCALCGSSTARLSLHHIHKHPRDDVEGNLVMLCGDGVLGCHGSLEAEITVTRRALGRYITAKRPDVLRYLRGKLGDEAADDWLERRLLR